jgi:hypothetical protein
VSVYEMQQCLFDYLRSMENAQADAPRPDLSVQGYDLTDEERNALVTSDIAAFHRAGVHPVIINGYCRAMGYKRADYRPLFDSADSEPRRKTRWQTS